MTTPYILHDQGRKFDSLNSLTNIHRKRPKRAACLSYGHLDFSTLGWSFRVASEFWQLINKIKIKIEV